MFTKFNIGELFNGSLLSIGLSVAVYNNKNKALKNLRKMLEQ